MPILGANGSGKTSLLRTISGLLAPSKGAIRFFGHAPRSYSAPAIAAMKVAHVPEGRGTIGGPTVEENLSGQAPICALQGTRSEQTSSVATAISRSYALIANGRRSLSGGEQQMLALSRALMMQPRLLLLDEPSFGLAPKIVRTVYDKIAEIIAQAHLSVLLVEQSIELAERLASRAYVLKNGRIVAAGKINELKKDSLLRDAYFSRGGSGR